MCLDYLFKLKPEVLSELGQRTGIWGNNETEKKCGEDDWFFLKSLKDKSRKRQTFDFHEPFETQICRIVLNDLMIRAAIITWCIGHHVMAAWNTKDGSYIYEIIVFATTFTHALTHWRTVTEWQFLETYSSRSPAPPTHVLFW